MNLPSRAVPPMVITVFFFGIKSMMKEIVKA